MITYKDIENLSNDHPLVKQFYKELEEEAYFNQAEYFIDFSDEESLAYFNKYVAGDR